MRVLKLAGLGVLALFVVLQLVPYGRTLSNPSTRAEPQWDSPRTRRLAKTSCFDCHSNETRKPVWAYVAPVSWLVQRDVDQGRDAMNLSEVGAGHGGKTDDAADAVRDSVMPPSKYTLLHPDAKLSASEKAELVAGLEATFGEGGGRRGRNRGRGDG